MKEFIYSKTITLSKEKSFLSKEKLILVYKDYYYLWLCELQKWLREKHGIKVIVDTNETLSWIWSIQSLYPQASYIGEYMESDCVFNAYEDAFEEGLFEALKLIP